MSQDIVDEACEIYIASEGDDILVHNEQHCNVLSEYPFDGIEELLQYYVITGICYMNMKDYTTCEDYCKECIQFFSSTKIPSSTTTTTTTQTNTSEDVINDISTTTIIDTTTNITNTIATTTAINTNTITNTTTNTTVAHLACTNVNNKIIRNTTNNTLGDTTVATTATITTNNNITNTTIFNNTTMASKRIKTLIQDRRGDMDILIFMEYLNEVELLLMKSLMIQRKYQQIVQYMEQVVICIVQYSHCNDILMHYCLALLYLFDYDKLVALFETETNCSEENLNLYVLVSGIYSLIHINKRDEAFVYYEKCNDIVSWYDCNKRWSEYFVTRDGSCDTRILPFIGTSMHSCTLLIHDRNCRIIVQEMARQG
jgi:hypothetical protein